MNKAELIDLIVEHWKANIGRVDKQFITRMKRKTKAELEKFARTENLI